MNSFHPPEPNVIEKPTADISLVQDKNGVIQTESYPVIPKPNVENDYAIPVKMSDLTIIKDGATKLCKSKCKWDEITIGIATMGFGSTLSAIASNVQLNTSGGKIFYIIIPIISFSLSVFVIMFKIMKSQTTKNYAKHIKHTIDPYIDSEKGENNELK